ncbi:hypothetical protein IQ230_25965 [Gloeocapsopsis crepidinum LEGE 06123]|uniref:Uncharacterized protein n=1 Tax=Gloeocapsopsis crepidinum LEGE 06123 TaxID=588587 RepID=A0ABR9V0B4_9CHRO|nr:MULTISPECIES: hypothetical protein [Gloeocapsopsis]MBE9193693.1 hypothetical protein [Gloeocapsopsis crepidinum LEGE 06123]
MNSHSSEPDLCNQKSSVNSTSDIIEQLKKLKPEKVVSSFNTYQEANAFVIAL